jgi:hypothetical protein
MEKFAALASNEAEFGAVLEFATRNPMASIECICLEYWPAQGHGLPNMALSLEKDFLSEKELDAIDERALFFSRHWYGFDKDFEKAIEFGGISLGFVSDFALLNIFKAIFLASRSAANAAGREKADSFLGIKGSFSGECAAIAARASGKGMAWLENTRAAPANAGIGLVARAKKAVEALGKLSAGLGRERVLGDRKGRLVFAKGTRYLGGVAEMLAREKGFAVCSLDDFVVRTLSNPLNAIEFARVKREKKAFFGKIFEVLFAKPGFRKRLVFDGMDFSDAFALRMPRFSARDWPEFVFLIGALRKEFARRKPFALVVWEDWIPFERICVLIAKQFGAKSLVVQHGIFSDSTKLPDWIRGFAPVVADRIAVWGPHYRQMLLAKRVPKEKIVVTGPSRLDSLHNHPYGDSAFRKRLGIGPGEKLVVLATQPQTQNTMQPRLLAEAALEAVKPLENARLAIKLHPLERIADYGAIAQAAGNKAILVEKTDLHQLLHCADLVIVHSSTVGLESMALRVPTIVFAEPGQANPFAGLKGGLVARNAGELKAIVAKALVGRLNRKDYAKAVEKYVYGVSFRQDGRATERVVRALKQWE